MSGSRDMVVDVGFMSIEVICNEFIKKVREERENDCWLKLTVKRDGVWGEEYCFGNEGRIPSINVGLAEASTIKNSQVG